MPELILAKTLDDKDLTSLSRIYVQMWGKVLQNEFSHLTNDQLVDEVLAQFNSRNTVFPEGQIVCWDHNDGVLGGVCSIMVSTRSSNGKPDYSTVPGAWNQLTSNGYFTNHDPRGDLLVCCAINVPPRYGGRGIPRRLLHGETALANQRGLIPCAYTRPIDLRAYLQDQCGFEVGFDHTQLEEEKLVDLLAKHLARTAGKGRLCDKNVGLHTHYGASVVRFLPNGREKDSQSCGFCILMAYPQGHVISATKN